MSYIEKLKSKKSQGDLLQKVQKDKITKKKPSPPTAKSAKRPFYSFCSTPGGHISKKGAPGPPAKKRHRQKIRFVTPAMVPTWRLGRAWILEHLAELEAAGWTRRELLRAGRFRYPCGTWGPAFTRHWTQEGVKIGIETSGDIVWMWVDATERKVTQRATRVQTAEKTN